MMITTQRARGIVCAMTLATVATVGGCTTTSGNAALRKMSPTEISEHLIRGVTTREEVKTLFGDPMNVSYMDNAQEAWSYWAGSFTNDPVNFVPLAGIFGMSMPGEAQYLVILFDEENRVQKYNFTNSDIGIKSGIFADQ